MARIVYAGSPDFAVPALQSLLHSSHEVVAVLTQPDRPAGRGRQLRPSPVKLVAEQAGVRVLQPEALSESLLQAQLKALTIDLMVVAAYGQLLPVEVLEMPRAGCVNLHASLLPRWRGASPIQTAILAGDKQTGVSLMRMEAGLDTGAVYATVSTDIRGDDTGGSLHDRLAQLGAGLLEQNLDALVAGSLRPEPQSEAGVSYAPRLAKADGVIDWQQSAAEIDCRIRAFNPWPVARTALNGEPLRCLMSAVAETGNEHRADAGAVTGVRGDALCVQTGAGELLLQTVQLPGRKPVSGKQLAGTLQTDGLVLGR